jgi:Pretoxin HINT domain
MFGAIDMIGDDLDVGADLGKEGIDPAQEEEVAAWDDLEQMQCGGLSFSPGTRVLLADGKTKPISQIKPGDTVIATNIRTGKTQAEPVTAVLVRHDTDLYDLKIKTDGRTAVVGTTSNHPFWVLGIGGHGGHWVTAGALRPGTRLRGPRGGSSVVIAGWVARQSGAWMLDLTVPGGDDHDFYIGTAVFQILVHNAAAAPAATTDTLPWASKCTNGSATCLTRWVTGTPAQQP